MQSAVMKARIRESHGKGEVSRLRKDGLVPAVVYGREKETALLQVEAKELDKVIKLFGNRGLVDLSIDTAAGSIKKKVLIKDLQINSIDGKVVHLDLQEVSMDQKVSAAIPIVFVGEEKREKDAGVIQHFLREVHVEALPSDLPTRAVLDVSILQPGDTVRVSDLNLGAEVVISTPHDEVIASVSHRTAQQPETETEGEAAETAES